jgi:transcriptional regulator with XRE-family HTH domain
LRARGVSQLERERRRRGLTATDLAELMGVSRSYLSRVEHGWLAPSAAFKQKASEALGTSVQELFPEFFFLSRADGAGVQVVGPGGRTLAFSTKRRATAAARQLSERLAAPLEVVGPAPLRFFALMHGVEEDEVLGWLEVDPDDLSDANGGQKARGPVAEPGLDRTSAGVGGGDESG